jgi:D-alanine-D-alanine ligase
MRRGAHQSTESPPTATRVLRVTVLCGGPSAEREVSLDSGRAVADALRRRGHDVYVADVGPNDLAALDRPADVVFPALHGPFGEDGTIQRIMAARGIRFVGADAGSSALAMDKVAAKNAVRASGIDTPAFEVWDKQTLAAATLPQIPLPVIVKPVDQGSSVATTVVREREAFLSAVRLTVAPFGRALVEQFIDGNEVTVGIVGTEPLPPIWVCPRREFYDYAAKYQDNATEYLFDAGYPAGVFERAQVLSRRVFAVVGCRHLARVDWMLDREERLWFLEINTLPGFTSHSLVPKAAQRAGISFEALVERLVWMALEGSA